MTNFIIFGDRGIGKTRLLVDSARSLFLAECRIEFLSLTIEEIEITSGIDYQVLPQMPTQNRKYLLDKKREKIKSGLIDFLFIDDLHFLDKWADWSEVLNLECNKIVAVTANFEDVENKLKSVKIPCKIMLIDEARAFLLNLLRDVKISKINNL